MGLFTKKRKVQPPYDMLNVEQQRAMYFLLEYFSRFAVSRYCGMNTVKQDALNYLEKATWYLGMSKKDVDLLRPYHQDIEYLYNVIKGVDNRQALDYMVNNCFNLVILSEDDNHEIAHEEFYDFWKRFGYSAFDIKDITDKYMYRTDI